MEVGFWLRLAILVIAILIIVSVPRGWCRWFCPTGAIMGFLGKNSIVGIGRNISKCDLCGICEDVCPTGVRILDEEPEKIRSAHCTLCLDCIDACPHNALRLKIK